MKLLLAIFLASLGMASVAIQAQESPVLHQSITSERELISLSEQWMTALKDKDRPTLERLMADRFYISPPGELDKLERSEWLKNALEMNWHSPKYHNFKVDIYGDTAVVTSRLDFGITTKWGIPISTNAPVTDVWVKTNGQWQVTARHFGTSSLEEKIGMTAAFVAGLGLCFMIWLLLKLRRRFTAKGKPG